MSGYPGGPCWVGAPFGHDRPTPYGVRDEGAFPSLGRRGGLRSDKVGSGVVRRDADGNREDEVGVGSV